MFKIVMFGSNWKRNSLICTSNYNPKKQTKATQRSKKRGENAKKNCTEIIFQIFPSNVVFKTTKILSNKFNQGGERSRHWKI